MDQCFLSFSFFFHLIFVEITVDFLLQWRDYDCSIGEKFFENLLVFEHKIEYKVKG